MTVIHTNSFTSLVDCRINTVPVKIAVRLCCGCPSDKHIPARSSTPGSNKKSATQSNITRRILNRYSYFLFLSRFWRLC